MSASLFGYRFSPTIKCSASLLALVLLTICGSTVAATPMSVSARANALAAGSSFSQLSGFSSIDTFNTLDIPYKCGFIVQLSLTNEGPCQSTNSHPAFWKSGSISHKKSHCSRPSLAWPISNFVCWNGAILETNSSTIPGAANISRRVLRYSTSFNSVFAASAWAPAARDLHPQSFPL